MKPSDTLKACLFILGYLASGFLSYVWLHGPDSVFLGVISIVGFACFIICNLFLAALAYFAIEDWLKKADEEFEERQNQSK